MALSRRTGQRFQGSIWPGFVDAMTGLLLVLMFVLTIFMVVQFVLRETITGQASKLDTLSAEVAALASALGLEERENSQLQARMGALNTTLNQTQTDLDQARSQLASQASIIDTLTAQRQAQDAALAQAQSQITAFEAKVAALLADQSRALDDIAVLRDERAALEARQAELLSEQEALNLALAQSRSEIDAQTEAARLDAARREALEALVADLRAQGEAQDAKAEQLTSEVAALEDRLSAEEEARLVEAAAAAALRKKLEDADTELTAMTLALEQQRQDAEDTLTLLAAAEAARADLDQRLLETLSALDQATAGVQARDELAERLTRVLAQMELAQSENAETVSALEAQITRLQSEVEQSRAGQSEAQARAAELRAQLEAELEQVQGEAATLRSDLARTRADLAAAETATQLSDQGRAAIEARLLAALENLEKAQAAATDQDELRSRLVAALAAQDTARQQAAEQLSLAEQRAILLAKARETLSEQEAISLEARRETELLNQQVSALRSQLGSLQALLDDYKARDSVAQVQLQTLGQDLNSALARAASEERKRRLLEEAERKRLETEALARAEEAERLKAEAKDLERYRSEFFGRLRDVLGDQEGVRIEGDRFVFSSEVLFAPGSANLSPEGEIEIAKVARILRRIADDIPAGIDWVIRVDGHTDDTPLGGAGKYADNWELSQGRALSVVRYMVNFLGIAPTRLSANGFGQYQPINPADTPEARAQNRRIELKLTEK